VERINQEFVRTELWVFNEKIIETSDLTQTWHENKNCQGKVTISFVFMAYFLQKVDDKIERNQALINGV
jgi:hypothetical protein